MNKHYETKYQIIYGDSVTGDTPLMLKDKKGFVHIKRIDELNDQWEPYE